jgi:hypothetical protein
MYKIVAFPYRSSNLGIAKMYEATINISSGVGYFDVEIDDVDAYRNNGYIGYVLATFVFSTGVVSGTINYQVASGASTVRGTYYASADKTNVKVRTVIWWRK